jgi:hypothetical protein
MLQPEMLQLEILQPEMLQPEVPHDEAQFRFKDAGRHRIWKKKLFKAIARLFVLVLNHFLYCERLTLYQKESPRYHRAKCFRRETRGIMLAAEKQKFQEQERAFGPGHC